MRAVTGSTPEQVNSAILAAASEDDEHPEHLNDTSFRHQARAAELLGWDLFTPEGAALQARAIPNTVAITIGRPPMLQHLRSEPLFWSPPYDEDARYPRT